MLRENRHLLHVCPSVSSIHEACGGTSARAWVSEPYSICLDRLTNPAGADRQVLGVFDSTKTELIAQALQALGLKRAFVVASEDGLDEFSISAPTKVTELKDRHH